MLLFFLYAFVNGDDIIKLVEEVMRTLDGLDDNDDLNRKRGGGISDHCRRDDGEEILVGEVLQASR